MFNVIKRQQAETETGEADKPTVAASFKNMGFARFTIDDLDLTNRDRQAFEAFAVDACCNLQPDPYELDSGRNRAYTCFTYVPAADALVPLQNYFDAVRGRYFTYYQRKGDQADFGGIRRKFPALAQQQIESPVLRALIEAGFWLAVDGGALPETDAYKVGVHIIQLEGRFGQISGVTPSRLHVDGEPVTIAMLMAVQNVKGGWNAITSRDHIGKHPDELEPSEIMARFTLKNPGEGYIVNDGQVAHHAENIELADPIQSGHRTILLIDFSPASFRRADDYKMLDAKQLEEMFN